jgi:hypothetical protein
VYNLQADSQNEQEVPNEHGKEKLLLVLGILCYGIATTFYFSKNKIQSFAAVTKSILFLENLADYLWSIPFALTIAVILLLIPLLHYYAKTQGKDVRYLRWYNSLISPSFMKYSFAFLLFIYTVLPLRWAQRSVVRAPDFPDYTPFDSILILLSLLGTILCSLYLFKKLPLKIVYAVEKVVSFFYKLKENYLIGSLLVLCFVTTAIIAYMVLDHIPHILDSIAQLFHAKIFLMGKLYAPLPPLKEFFDYAHIINDTKWYSQYPPGHSFLLMLGLLIGAPWFIGPFLGTLSLFTFYHITKNIYRDHRISYLSVSLLMLSPFFLFMSSSHMNHTSNLFFILLFLYFYLRIFSSHSSIYALISGLSLGYAINIRPLTAVAIAIPFICNVLIRAYRKREVTMRKVFIFFIGVSLMVTLLLLYNDLTTGNPFLFGYQKKYQTLGFLGSAQGWQPQPHNLKGGVINTSNNLIGLNQYLFEWPIPSLIFIFIFFLSPLRKNRWDYLFLYATLSLILSYFFYYHQDYIFGPRFYYSLIPFVIILTVRGFLEIPHLLEKKRFNRTTTESTLYLCLFLCLVYMASFSFPSLIKKYSNDYWWVTDQIHEAVEKQKITNAIVFIDCWHPPDTTKPNLIYYGSGFQFNSPDLKDDVIYALDLKEKNSELMKLFPDREYYFVPFFWDRDTVAW